MDCAVSKVASYFNLGVEVYLVDCAVSKVVSIPS